MDYLVTLQKYVSGKQYASSNVKTSDGKVAYITASGVSKMYPSNEVYKKTAGKNNCGSGVIQLSPKWDDLGFAVGSLMKSGQSCGYENSYVQPKPPDTTFDWRYYIKSNPTLNLTTESQALNHWNTIGKQEGKLPNATALTSMQFLGKVGYIDVNTNLHLVPPTYDGTYTSYTNSNITGIKMENCSRPIPSIKYGEQLILYSKSNTGFINTSSVLEMGTQTTNLFLRPVGLQMPNQAVKYGDQVSITNSISSSNSCGTWGCKVGKVNSVTQQFEFGPGGNLPATFEIVPPLGSSYVFGTDIKYGDPFLFKATIGQPNSILEQDAFLTPGKSIKSPNGRYMFIYQTDGNVCLYNTNGGGPLWCSMAVHDPGVLIMQGDGNLVAYDSGGVPRWATGTNGQGPAPYRLTLKNNRSAVVTDSSNAILWDTQTGGQSTEPDTITGYAYVKNSIVTFDSWNVGKNSNIFSFNSQLNQPDTCDIEDMKKHCDEVNCSGFIHSPQTNTWQMITDNGNYGITSTNQDIYLKNAKVDLHDSSCLPGTSQFIDASLFGNYVQGDDFVDGGTKQCRVVEPPKPQQDNLLKQAKKYVNDYNQIQVSELQQQNVDANEKMAKKTQQYQSLLDQIGKFSPSQTLSQQYTDMKVFDDYNASHAILWGILATVVLTGILFRNKIDE